MKCQDFSHCVCEMVTGSNTNSLGIILYFTVVNFTIHRLYCGKTPESRNSEVRITFIARQRLGKHIVAQTNTQVKSSNFVVIQRRCKHVFPTTEALFSARSVQSGYKEEFS
jgi:hypothetical protein